MPPTTKKGVDKRKQSALAPPPGTAKTPGQNGPSGSGTSGGRVGHGNGDRVGHIKDEFDALLASVGLPPFIRPPELPMKRIRIENKDMDIADLPSLDISARRIMGLLVADCPRKNDGSPNFKEGLDAWANDPSKHQVLREFPDIEAARYVHENGHLGLKKRQVYDLQIYAQQIYDEIEDPAVY